jgi:hypothetical membrane protein
MTTMGLIRDRPKTAPPPRSRSIARQALLMCGLLSSGLYIATDIVGGLRYPDYSFTSQAISELAAVGAPSEGFVDPLFLTYGVLALAFSVAVFREGAGRSRALRFAGGMLIGYAAIGVTASLAAPTFFKMHQRGAGSLAADAPHIVLTSVLVLFLLLAIGFAAFALGSRFRIYSFATLATVIAFGALSGRYAPQVAANQPTPGLGIVERIDVYSAMLWLAVFTIVLLRRPGSAINARWPRVP